MKSYEALVAARQYPIPVLPQTIEYGPVPRFHLPLDILARRIFDGNVKPSPGGAADIEVTCAPKTGPGVMLGLDRKEGDIWQGTDTRRNR